MNRVCLVLMAGLSLFAVSPAGAAESPFLGGFLQESRVVYPLRIGDWQAAGERRYTEQDEGASVSYRNPAHPAALLSVYFYPAGQLTKAQLQQSAQQTLEGIVALAGNPEAGYRTIEAAPLQQVALVDGNDGTVAEAWLATLRIESSRRTFNSTLGMLVKDLYFIKLRLSAADTAADPATLRQEMAQLLRELAQRTVIVSTGECWDPLPLVVRRPLDPAAKGVLLKIEEGGVARAVAFADRVEVLDPEGNEAVVTQALASFMSGRIPPGCVMPQDINPEVREGMRELRFEYRLPHTPEVAAAIGAGGGG
ncbi:hypothetical protein [Stenotrophomonas sp. YIM B06876]|uniref:hypothetical protein n=1 Tax=Stenotrophomonas sp. YIM B06876 TaxID=3060211 RepID=UPI0027382634|nr:hypothetical protein [Stenotrophomonas sp. YIM B06876]